MINLKLLVQNINIYKKGSKESSILKYQFTDEGIIVNQKISGEWIWDDQIQQIFNFPNFETLLSRIKENFPQYSNFLDLEESNLKNIKNALYTIIVKNYLQQSYPEKSAELKLIYAKADKFIQKYITSQIISKFVENIFQKNY